MTNTHKLPIVKKSATLGEQGMVLVQKLAPTLGFLFRDATKGDYGIDAFLEKIEATNDPATSYATGRLLAVQIKCGKVIAREHPDSYRLYCTPANINYWKRHSLPVIVIYCNPVTESCYWVKVSDEHLHKARVNWVLTIPKKNKLEDAKTHLTDLSEDSSKKNVITKSQDLILLFDEELGLTTSSDEELGIMCSEFISASKKGADPKIIVDITTQEVVTAKLEELDDKPSLTLEERKDRILWDAIESRYAQKRADISACVEALLISAKIGSSYFWGWDHAATGRALRYLTSKYTISPSIKDRALSIDVYPSERVTDPCLKIGLNKEESEAFLSTYGITDVSSQFLYYHGYLSLNLPREVFVEKFLPELVFTLQIYANRSSVTQTELLSKINVPVEDWIIGLS